MNTCEDTHCPLAAMWEQDERFQRPTQTFKGAQMRTQLSLSSFPQTRKGSAIREAARQLSVWVPGVCFCEKQSDCVSGFHVPFSDKLPDQLRSSRISVPPTVTPDAPALPQALDIPPPPVVVPAPNPQDGAFQPPPVVVTDPNPASPIPCSLSNDILSSAARIMLKCQHLPEKPDSDAVTPALVMAKQMLEYIEGVVDMALPQ
jgi:hypothetical protein